VSKEVLVIGCSEAGIQIALDLADFGISVHLVERSPFLGITTFFEYPQHLKNSRLLEIAKHPNIHIWTNTSVVNTKIKGGSNHVELCQHPRYIDLSKCTACGDCLEVCPVTVPGTNHKAIYMDGQPGCMAIDKVGISPCVNACPGGIHVQGYIALIARGRFQEAIDLVREAIPFPGICGRVCTHPCEINCRRVEIDQPVAIRLLKRFLADWELKNGDIGDTQKQTLPSPREDKIAIVGAGPGGMAAADRLARQGYQVTVFDKLPVVGGMMAIGIPEYRLPREVIAREYEYIRNLGVDIRLNTSIGPNGDHTLGELFELGYQAVCLAIGAHKSQNLNIPGEDLAGVVHGIELLEAINLSQQLKDNKHEAELEHLLSNGDKTRVAVLGGGNTAMDVSRALIRLGWKDVRILYRRTRAEMPALPEEIEDVEYEGVDIEYLVSPVRVLGEAGRVTGLECIRMELGEIDESGRRKPIPVKGSEFIVSLDMVVLAIGQSPKLDILGETHDFVITSGDRIEVDSTTYMTSRSGVFAVGDAVTSDKMAVIEAIAMGKKAATAIDSYLRGEKQPEKVNGSRNTTVVYRELTEGELVQKSRTNCRTISKKQRQNSFEEVELGFTAKQAITEAQRCLMCGLCSECMACVEVCKTGAVIHNEEKTFVDLDVGAIIYMDDPSRLGDIPLKLRKNFYQVSPKDAQNGSAVTARVMVDLYSECESIPQTPKMFLGVSPPRIGIVICQCGGEISQVVDTQVIRERAASWSDVVHTQELPFSCSAEAAADIRDMVSIYHLNKVVLAGCTCCELNQVCYSCTYQRVRLKENLGLFALPECTAKNSSKSLIGVDSNVSFEFVNIREHCAWMHSNEPQIATEKAINLIAAGVAKTRIPDVNPHHRYILDKSVILLGTGITAETCYEILVKLGFTVYHFESVPDRVTRMRGQYVVSKDDKTIEASALILTPQDKKESKRLMASFSHEENKYRKQISLNGVETSQPGVFFCDPKINPEQVGAVVSARVGAWFGHQNREDDPTIAVVDPARCRTCGTCIDICEYGAPELISVESNRFSWIDPVMCKGCGTCAAHCPSGAITAGCWTDDQLENAIDMILLGESG
jgi:NADPH-dependent glutamate synthase beta subunit-like oxidoreductase/NAD-dependent dihydropyrimidine dehydrogenase PreA subunit